VNSGQLAVRRKKQKQRKNLPFWGLLTIWLVMGSGFSAYFWFLVRQDESIAPREKVVLGSIYKRTHWKHESACYSFTYAGREYHGCETVRPDQCFCDVAVYFDPAHPSTNTLVKYRHKSKQDHEMMIGCAYASAGLAAILAFVLWIKRSRKQSQENNSID
jgi:hypothetical protein